MRALIQRVTSASVVVGDRQTGAIDDGYLILLGVTHNDGPDEIELLANKIVNLRILEDADGAMNRSALDVNTESPSSIAILVVSQFTLYADVRKGRRPSWTDAAPPDVAAPLVEAFCAALRAHGFRVETGIFGADMAVSLINDGPVTIWLDSNELRQPRRS